MKRARLRDNQADIWLMSLSEIDDAMRFACRRFLSGAELAQWQRLLLQAPRDQYLVARALVRKALSSYAGVPEDSWQFTKNDYGRPAVLEPAEFRDLHFNLSHTDGLVALTVSTIHEVGIDVENVNRDLEAHSLASSFFAPPEAAVVAGRLFAEARDAFFSFWTLKEAYIKARGMGVSIPLDSFWFELQSPRPKLHCEDRCKDEPSRWQFYQSAPTASHKLALAIATAPGAQAEIQSRWVGGPFIAGGQA